MYIQGWEAARIGVAVQHFPDTRLGSLDTHLCFPDTHLRFLDARLGSSDTHLGSPDTHLRFSDARLGSSDTRLGALDNKVCQLVLFETLN